MPVPGVRAVVIRRFVVEQVHGPVVMPRPTSGLPSSHGLSKGLHGRAMTIRLRATKESTALTCRES